MNPRVSRSSRAGLEGDRLPDRQDRRAARGRLPARRDPQRHHAPHARLLRADDRLRRRQVAALRVREVPRRRRGALDAHEVGRRGDGDRAHLPAGVREGDALARARRRRARRADGDLLDAPRDPRRRPLRRAARGLPRRARREDEVHARTAIDPWFLRELRELALDPEAPFRGVRTFKAVDTCAAEFAAETPYYYSAWERAARRRGPPRRQAERDDPRLGPEPDRAGDRVRLLLRARRDDRARVRPRRGDGQLQPGDGVDRLRHLRPPVLRAADARGRARRSSRSSSPRA